MEKRSRSYFRQQRIRAIKKKLNIIKSVWRYSNDDLYPHPWMVHPGKLSKGKLNCSCRMCKYEKHYSIPKAKEGSKLLSMLDDIADYLKE